MTFIAEKIENRKKDQQVKSKKRVTDHGEVDHLINFGQILSNHFINKLS